MIDVINDKEASIKVLDGARDAIDLSAEEHPGVLRKLDWHILPVVSLLYLLSFL